MTFSPTVKESSDSLDLPASKSGQDSWTLIHVISLDDGVLAEVQDHPVFQHIQWVHHDSPAVALEQLSPCSVEQIRVLVAVENPSQLEPGWIKEIHRRIPSLRLVMFVRRCDLQAEKDFLAYGGNRLLRLPVPHLDPSTFFNDQAYLSTLFPGSLPRCRQENLQLELLSEKKFISPVIRLICERLDLLGYPQKMVRSIIPMILDEALTNSMKHGNGWDRSRTVKVEAEISEEGFSLSFQDQGEGFIREEVACPLDPERIMQEGGRGLFLMESFMDDVRYEDGGRRIVLVKSLSGDGSNI